MKALSVRQPWAELILRHGKDVENRTWSTHYRGLLMLHAGKAIDAGDCADMMIYLHEIARLEELPNLNNCARGAILGVIELLDVVADSSSPWAEPGLYHWVVRPRLVLDEPIPCSGRLGLFEVPDDALAAVQARMAVPDGTH